MKIATILFTYHRSYHTEKVLESLKRNTVSPQKLFVFQDGLKLGEDECEWKKVNELIQNIDWCDKEIIVSNTNKGLADSIILGINYVFTKYDAIIVLEDDCLTAPSFMQFMTQGLTQYARDKKVYSISGYSWPIELKNGKYDAYGCGRCSTWGWGTWKDRWEKYSRDNVNLKHFKMDRIKSKNLAIWGKDLESMLLGTVEGRYDSWGVFWGLNIIENEGVCINPYSSLIKHIGGDDSGTNVTQMVGEETKISDKLFDKFILPEDVTILNSTREAFVKRFGNYTAISQEDIYKEDILVYGLGNFYIQNERNINETYNIQAFVDRKKYGWFAGKKIIRIDKMEQYQYSKILIMVLDIQECINIAKALIEYGVSSEKILLGISLFGFCEKNVSKINVLANANEVSLSVSMNGVTIGIRSKDEFYNAYEALVQQIWNYTINNGKEDVVLDVGTNIGDTVLYFLHKKNVKKVFGYEPFRKPYLDSIDNLQYYMQHSERVEIFQYGISNENNSRIINFNKDMTCGQSTISGVREKAFEWYRNIGLVQVENEEKELIQVKDAAEVFAPIIHNYSHCNIVLKMNCEGEEYNIMDRLSKTGLLSRISVIMLEWHYKGKEDIVKYLNEAGFTYWCNDRERDMGLIYAFRA